MNSMCILVLAASLFQPVDQPTPATGKGDLQQFQGSWRATSILNDGNKSTPDELDQTRLVVTGDRFTLKGKDFTLAGRFTIDMTRSPKQIDVILDAKEGGRPAKLLGIYRIDGETRRSCFAFPDQPRPKDFPADSRGTIQFEWTKVK